MSSDLLDRLGILRTEDVLHRRNGHGKPVSKPANKAISDTETPAPPWKPFPVSALPDPIQTWTKRAAAAIGVDPSYPATALLAVLAAAIGTSRVIRLKRGWIEPSVLWCALVGYSGELKSPVLDAALRYVRRKQSQAVAEYRDLTDEFTRDLAQFKINLDDWKKRGKSKGEPQPEEPIKPVCRRYCCSDVTVEGLACLLSDTPRGLLLDREELSGWVQGFDQYKGGRGADTAHWLTIHGARPLLVDRKSGDQKIIHVTRAAVSIVGGIQPDILRRVLGSEHWEDGLAARLLLCMPPRKAKSWSEAEIDEQIETRLAEVLDRLYGLEPKYDEDDLPEPVVVGLASSGKAAWIKFYNEHAVRLADATGNAAALLAKIEGTAARLALVVHLVRQAAGDRTAGDRIDEQDVSAGVSLARWYADESIRIYATLAESDEDKLSRQIVELIERRGGSITANDLRRRSRHFDFTEDAEQFLDGLVKAGIGVWDTPDHGEAGGRPTREFVLSNLVSVSETQKHTENNRVSETAGGENDGSDDNGGDSDETPDQAVVSETYLKRGENEVSDSDTEETGENLEWETITI